MNTNMSEHKTPALRKGTLDDVALLCDLGRRTTLLTFGVQNKAEHTQAYLDEAFSAEQMERELRSPGSTFYILEQEGAAIGYLKLNLVPSQTDVHDPESLEVQRLYLDEGAQGQGLGAMMLEYAAAEAKALGKRYVWLGVWEHNERALAFYKRNGFYKMGEHEFVFGGDPQTDLLYRKDL